jgi:preprotein translocase subunit SecD
MKSLLKTLSTIIGISFISIALAVNTQQNSSMFFQANQSKIVFDHTTIESANIIVPQKNVSTYTIKFKLKTQANNDLEKIAQENIGAKAEIILNGKVISSTTIRDQLGKEFMITGLTKKEVEEFLLSLKLTKMEQAEQKESRTICSPHSKLCQTPLELK